MEKFEKNKENGTRHIYASPKLAPKGNTKPSYNLIKKEDYEIDN